MNGLWKKRDATRLRKPGLLDWTFLASVILVLASPAVVVAQANGVREEFRAFYEPLWPDLKRSYSNIRFQCAMVSDQSGMLGIRLASGFIGLSEFTFDRLPVLWLPDSEFQTGTLKGQFGPDAAPQLSGGCIRDYAFLVKYGVTEKDKRLQVFHDHYPLQDDFHPGILAPLCSVQLRQSYHSILNDPEIEFLDLMDRRLRTGQRVKTLFYRPTGFPEVAVFEADFDATTGVCLASQEMTRERPGFPIVTQVSFAEPLPAADDQPAWLPAPVRITGNFAMLDFLQVVEYERIGQLDGDALSVTRYGFDESATQRPQSMAGQVAYWVSRLLLTMGLVILLLLLFLLALMLIVSSWAKRKGPTAI